MDGANFSGAQASGGRVRGRAPSIRLAELVEHEVIPRLLLSRRGDVANRRPSAAHVETLARLALARDASAATAQVAALRETGVPTEVLLNDLITPAARRLGDFWVEDTVTFVDVAMAAARLVAIVRGLDAHGDVRTAVGRPCALIATLGGERHGLGALALAQTLRCGGWRVTEAPGVATDALATMAARETFDLIGLSLGDIDNAGALHGVVARLRRATRNRDAAIAVGGPAFVTDPSLADSVGADFCATDGRDALTKAQAHLSNLIGSVRT